MYIRIYMYTRARTNTHTHAHHFTIVFFSGGDLEFVATPSKKRPPTIQEPCNASDCDQGGALEMCVVGADGLGGGGGWRGGVGAHDSSEDGESGSEGRVS
jgi:hypothetical protein